MKKNEFRMMTGMQEGEKGEETQSLGERGGG